MTTQADSGEQKEQVEQSQSSDTQYKSRMDKRVSEAEKMARAAEQRAEDWRKDNESLREQLRLRGDLPEDAEEAVKELAAMKSQVQADKRQVELLSKTTLAQSYARELGVEPDVFMAF